MKSVFVLALIAGFVCANTLFNNPTFSSNGLGEIDTIDKMQSACTNVNGHPVCFVNVLSGSSVTFSKTVTCSDSKCGFVFDKTTNKYFSIPGSPLSINTITSGNDGAGKMHIYVAAYCEGDGTVTIGEENVELYDDHYIILQLSDEFVVEKVIDLDSAWAGGMTVFNGELLALLSVKKSSSKVEFMIDDKEDGGSIDPSLTTEMMNLIAVSHFGAGSDFFVQKIGGISTRVYADEAAFLLDETGSLHIAVPYLLEKKVVLTVGKDTYSDADAMHGFAITMTVSKSGSSTQLTVGKVVDCQAQDLDSFSIVFLDKDTLAVAANLGKDFNNCPAQSTSVATYDIKSTSNTFVAFKCLNTFVKKGSLRTVMASVIDDYFVLASSMFYQLMVDEVTVWRSKADSSAYSCDTPYVALIRRVEENKEHKLVVEDGFSFFSQNEPSVPFEPIGVFKDLNSVAILYAGQDKSTSKYTHGYAAFSLKTCRYGLFSSIGECVCFYGKDESDVCLSHAPSSSSGHTHSTSSLGPVHPSSTAPASTSSALLSTSADDSAAEPFLESQLSVIIFGCTAAVFFIATVVFVILFSVKRCGKSSGSSAETSMSTF